MGHLQNWVEGSATDLKRLSMVAKRLYVLAYFLLFLAFLQFMFALSRRDDAMVMMFVALWFVMATTNFVLAELYRERYQRLKLEMAVVGGQSVALHADAATSDAAPCPDGTRREHSPAQTPGAASRLA